MKQLADVAACYTDARDGTRYTRWMRVTVDAGHRGQARRAAVNQCIATVPYSSRVWARRVRWGAIIVANESLNTFRRRRDGKMALPSKEGPL